MIAHADDRGVGVVVVTMRAMRRNGLVTRTRGVAGPDRLATWGLVALTFGKRGFFPCRFRSAMTLLATRFGACGFWGGIPRSQARGSLGAMAARVA